MLRSPTKLVTNIPPGVGADSSRPYPNIIKYVYSRHQIRVSVSPHTHIHIINYVFSHHRTHISATLFVGVFIYAGTINRSPTAANGLPKCPQRIAKTHTTQTQKHYHCAPPYCYLFYKTHIQPHTNTHYI